MTDQYKIRRATSPNKSNGRRGNKVIAIVNHITAGRFPGCLSWMRNPQAQASAHYLVTRDGEIYQMVKDEDISWHAGAVKNPSWKMHNGINPNYRTIGIEHEGYQGNGGDGSLTETQYQATLWLHRQLIAKYGIPVDRDHIIGHYQIDSITRANCPGPKFPWKRLMQDLAGGYTKTVEIQVGGKALTGILMDEATFAPVREFGNALGHPVSWDATKGVSVGGVKVDVRLVGNVSYAPVRYLAESLGKKVSWDAASGKVVIE
jgi:N-acetylmuramoyl-L-alanine amidase